MFNAGEFVKIKNSNIKGKIISIHSNSKENTCVISTKSKKIKVCIDDIEKTTPISINTSKKVNINIDYSYEGFTPEIMIRHQNLDIAMYNVENFVNEAVLNKVKEIRIIHGRSGGILRNGVHEYLKHNKNVESFRLGNYYEGSYGVTIVKLKTLK